MENGVKKLEADYVVSLNKEFKDGQKQSSEVRSN